MRTINNLYRPLKFGIELEVVTSKTKEEIIDKISQAGIKVRGDYYGSDVDYEYWKVQDDASLERGWEIVSPPLSDIDEVLKVVHILRKDLGVRCNKNTGFHIHHDISDLSLYQIQNLFILYAKYEGNAISSILRKNRQDNEYCESILTLSEMMYYNNEDVIPRTIKDVYDLCYFFEERYLTLNIQSFLDYGTIEFRQHHGTANINEVIDWIIITHKFIEHAEFEDRTNLEEAEKLNNKQALDLMLLELGIDDKIVTRHLKSRQNLIKRIN